MASRVLRSDGVPARIASEADLEAHLGRLVRIDRRFRAVMARARSVPLRRIEPGFKGLFWVITGQQISTAAARAIFARCEAALGAISPHNVASASDALLKTAGLSTPKIKTLRAAAEAILHGRLALESLLEREAEDAVAHLVAVKGIGPWTAEVYLLFGLGHPDVFPAGDLALKESARVAFDLPERPGHKEFAAYAQAWRPHRSAAARLLWAHYAVLKGGDATPVTAA